MWKKYCIALQATWQYGACALHAVYVRLQMHTHKLLKAYSFSTTTKVTQTRMNTTLYVDYLSCLLLLNSMLHIRSNITVFLINWWNTSLNILILCWPCVLIYLFINIKQLDALNFIISLFQASTCFEHTCSSSGGQKLYYTFSGIITLKQVGGLK